MPAGERRRLERLLATWRALRPLRDRLPPEALLRRAVEALEHVGLGDRVRHRPNELSGGQRQRVAIARAIVGTPRILLADEPTGNLDSQMGDEIMHILHGLQKDSGTTIVMVTHDPRLAARCDRVIELVDGRIKHDEAITASKIA